MTTQSGKGGEKAASPNDTELIHLKADHDNLGDTVTWCQKQFVPITEEFAKTTCLTCLEVIKIYAEGAAVRLQQLQASQAKPSKGRKRHIDRDSGADGHNGVWGT